MSNPIVYLLDKFPQTTFERRDAPRRGPHWNRVSPGQGQNGYGTKITSDYRALIDGRRYRVYITQISNAGSLWIEKNGERLHLKDGDIPDGVRYVKKAAT